MPLHPKVSQALGRLQAIVRPRYEPTGTGLGGHSRRTAAYKEPMSNRHIQVLPGYRAVWSPCSGYRYVLWRLLRETDAPGVLQVVGLNPSTADEHNNDPTLRRCMDYAQRWGFDALCMTNLFALRATDPKTMMRHPDPVGADNDTWLRRISERADLILVAWGNNGAHRNRAAEVLPMLPNPHALGVTKPGQPRHPLYAPKALEANPVSHA